VAHEKNFYYLFFTVKNLSGWLGALACMVFDFESIDTNYVDAALIFTTHCQYICNYCDKHSKYSKCFILFKYFIPSFFPSIIYLLIGSATPKQKANMFSTAICPSVSLPAQTNEDFVCPSLGCEDHSKYLNFIFFPLVSDLFLAS